ncbi:MAG: radical SAM protein [Candidatus Saelkia tenebricola]|nr:radical SAM protein [Candidatus Saelkia tenebricola]
MKAKNIFKMGLGSLGYKVLNRRKPLNVMFSVTDRCTSNCLYCAIPEREKVELTTSDIINILDQLKHAGCERLGIWGGEPLLRSDIGEIIRYSKRKGFFVTLDTNGQLLPEKLRDIKKIDHVNIGFDGPQEAHDKLRGKDNFKKAIRAFECLRNNNIPFWTITVLTKFNIMYIEEIINYAMRYGFKTTFQILHHNEYLSRNHEHLYPSDDELREAIKKIIDFKKQKAPIASSFNYLNYLLEWPDYKVPTLDYEKGGINCLAGKLFCNIDTDGSLFPCSLLVDKIYGPNILENGFQPAFNSMTIAPCKACAASCYVEYNHLFALNPYTLFEWLMALKK